MTRVSLLFVALAIAACGSESIQPQLVPSLNIIEGDAQIDTVAKQLPSAIVAQAEDKESGAKMGNVVLNWFRVVGTDSTFLGAGLTDDTGVARLRPTLATKAGPQTFVAWALDAEGERTEFAAAGATALAGVAATFLVPAPDTAFAPAFPDTTWIEYTYRDQYANTSWACAGDPDAVAWDTFDGLYAAPIDSVRIENGRHYQGIEVRGSHGALRVIATASCLNGAADTVSLTIQYTGP